MSGRLLLIKFKRFPKWFSFLIFSLLLIIFVTKGFAQSNEMSEDVPVILTTDEYRQLQERLHYLASEDSEKRLVAVGYLERFVHYFEVKEAFLETLLTELDRNPPNSRLITIIITSVFPFLSSQDAFTLNQLNQHHVLQGMPLHFSLSVFINKALSRSPEDINTYTLSDMQNKASHYTLLTTNLYSLPSNLEDDDIRQNIRILRRGSVQFLSDHLSVKEPYHSQVYQDEAIQVMDALTQSSQVVPIIVGSEDHNQTMIRTVTQNISNTPYNTERRTYIIKTIPSRIKKIHENSLSHLSETKNLKDYLDAILDIEDRLQISIVIFMDRFHRLSDLQFRVLRTYLERREKPIKLIAASSNEGYSEVPEDIFHFKEIRANRMPVEDLRHVIKKSILPRLSQHHFHFEMSENAINDIVDHINEHYRNEPLIVVAKKLIDNLLVKKRQKIALDQNAEAYLHPIKITDEEVRQILLIDLQQDLSQQDFECGKALILI